MEQMRTYYTTTKDYVSIPVLPTVEAHVNLMSLS